MNILLLSLLLSIGLNIFVLFIAYLRKSDQYTDLTYAISFGLITYLYYYKIGITSPIAWINIILITLWAIRLGAFLAFRISKIKKDNRFDNIRVNFSKFFGFFILQAIVAWVVSLPSYVMAMNQAIFRPWSLIAALFAFIALVIEMVADIQKYQFKAKGNKGLIKTGLYSIVRYPNYYGEIGFWKWIAIFGLFNLDAINYTNISLLIISPFTIAIIIRYASGIRILEKQRDQRFKDDPSYWDYKNKVNMLVPKWPPYK